MGKYYCGICDKVSNQKSHHEAHLQSELHLTKVENFRLELEQKSIDEILKEYPEYKITCSGFTNEDYLIDGETPNDNITAVNTANIKLKFDLIEKIIVSKTTHIMNTKTMNEPNKYKPTNKVVWELSDNVDINENYKQIKSNLESLIKQCHNILYSSSIVGQKAQNDIMRLLCIKILQYQFNDESSELWDKCNMVKANRNISDINFKKYKSLCTNLTELYKSNKGILTEWKGFVNKFLSGENGVFPSIYYEDDSKFNCIDEATLQQLIDKIESIKIDDAFVDSFSTTCGDIHESFRSYGGGKGAKELGQYFTPRQLIHLIFHGLNLNQYLSEIDNPSIYDPCMGTAGFLTRLFNLGNINPENIYGCETELDTIKFGEMSLFLTTKGNKQNIVKCNSLSENPFMIDTKVDAIVTNPPFGTKMNYKSLKETYEKTFPDSTVKFEDMYPLKVNNGACLFVQHCVYMLNDGGVCAIVLPDGELFDGNSKWSKTFRKWLCKNVNIHIILKCPGGTFDHAGVKTNVVVFTKDGPTQNIKYIETTKECEKINELITITKDDLEKTQYSLDINEYIEEEETNFEVPIVKLGDTCEYSNGGVEINKSYWNKGDKVLYTCSKNSMLSNFSNFPINKLTNNNDLLVSRNGTPYIHIVKENCIYSNVVQRLKIKEEFNVYYIYYYVKTILKEMIGKGQTIPSFNMNIWNNIDIPLPSLENQEKIVEELSIIETNIDSIETRIEQLKEEKERFKKYSRKSEIKELLKDTDIQTFGEICKLEKGKLSSTHFKSLENGEYPVISNGKYKENWQKVNTYNNDGSFVYMSDSFAGDGSGDLTIHYYEGKCNHTNLSNKLITNDKINDLYLYYILTEDIRKYNKLYQKGSSKPVLDKDKIIKKMKIPVPTPEIQEQCIQIYQEKETFIQSIDDKIEAEKKYIEELKQLSKDIIHNYC